MSKIIKKIKLGDIGKVLMCKRVLKHQTSGYGDIPFFKISTFGDKPDTFITKDLYEDYRKKYSHPRKGDILISAAGTIGKTVVYDGKPSYFQDSNIVWIDNNELILLNSFLYYFYQTKPWVTTSGSTITRIYNEDLRNIKISFPENLQDQQKIASVLSTLDAKIELNNKINTELEAMAKTLYDYWFVQFDFPDSNGKPYKSSGGEMVWSEALKRKIPKGWEVKELGDIISRSGTGLNPRDNFQLGFGKNYYITIKNIKGGKIIFDESCDRVDDESLKIINKRSDLQIGDILFTSIEPVGVTYLLHEKPKNWNINESVFTLRPDYSQITSEYLYMLLSSIEMKVYTKNASAGSIHKGIRHSVLKMFKLPYKNKELTEKFSMLVNPILKRIKIIDEENQKLAELRDFLLPMLMNGQVVVE